MRPPLRLPPLFAALALVGLAVAALGCPPAGLTSTCRFRGEATTCGACIAAACRSELDTCCADDGTYGIGGCVETLGQLDGCAERGDCKTFFETSSYDAPGAGTAMRTCARGACTAACGGAEAGIEPSTLCWLRDDGACACRMVFEPEDGGTPVATCGPRTFDDGGTTAKCCAETGWPSSDTLCLCLPLGCFRSTTDASDCVCGSFRDTAGYERTPSCTAEARGTCCRSDTVGTCQCWPAGVSCGDGLTETSRCDASTLRTTCPSDSSSVSACAF